MQRIDLMAAIAQRPFFKTPKKRYGLMGALVLSNIIWVVVVSGLAMSVLTLTKTGSFLANQWRIQNSQINRLQEEKDKAVAERDAKISRLLASSTNSRADVLQMARTIQKIFNTANNASQSRFLEEALPEALRIQMTEGIPASAVLAQAIYESSYGTSRLSREFHNYHGIKAFSNWSGPRAVAMPTLEYGTTPTIADFRAYPSLQEGFNGYAEFLKSNDRYSGAFSQKTGMAFVRDVVNAGYCPDPHYLGSIKDIIERHDLTILDEIYAAEVAKASAPVTTMAKNDTNS